MKLSDARTAAEALNVLARRAWYTAHDGAECPPARIPAPEDLVAWRSEWPADVMAECARRLTDLLRASLPAIWGMPLDQFRAHFKWESKDGALVAVAVAPYIPPDPANVRRMDPDSPGVLQPALPADADTRWLDATGAEITVSLSLPLTKVHAEWCKSRQQPHPIEPLVSAWQRLAEVPATPRVLVERASLARLSKLGADEATLPDFPQREVPLANGQLLFDLPDFGPLVRGCPSWLLWLFDRAGGKSLAAGHGAPWDLALFVFALLHLDVADRDGTWRTLEVATLADDARRMQDATGRPWPSAEAWLYGDSGWTNRRRDWHKLPEALERMTKLAYLPIPGIGRVAVLFPSVIPSARSDPLIQFTIRVPRVAATGDRLNWRRLTEYRRDSARLFRAYLAVAAWFGRSARNGHPITRTIAAPVLGPDGKPRRRKGGAIIRTATERIPNPAERYVAPLSEADLTCMIGFDPTDRSHRRYARLAFGRMEADEVIEMVRDDAGWKLFAGPNW